MSHPLAPPRHPVLACVGAVRTALAEVRTVEPMFMATTDKERALVEITAAAAQLEELRLRVLATADDVAATTGARDAGAWLAHRVRLDDRAGRADLALARSLQDHVHVAEALRDGVIDRARAVVVAAALEALPADVDDEVVGRAERHLVAEAGSFEPARLRRLGRQVLAVVAPEADDELEARRLAAEEAHAASVTRLTTRARGDGTTDIAIRCADAVAARLLTYLESLTSPRHAPDDRRPYPQRLGQAFGAFLEAVDPERLPLHGGDATTVIVTIDLATLLGGLGVALVGDEPISASEARRLACQAGLVPAVLDGESRVLDLGRTQRLYTRSQRKAMAVRDRTCRAEGCTIPAAWCEAHHLQPWSQGGRTDLDDGALLCSHHHHLAHDDRYDLTRHPDGSIRFHRRE